MDNHVEPFGEAIYQELLWIHDILRRNLETITALVNQSLDGAPAEQIRALLDDLAVNSLFWRLRTHCLQYCFLVHGHHHHEDAVFFPMLRHASPDLDTVIDKLEADHIRVAQLLHDVEAAAERLADDSGRAELAKGLRALSEHLLAHLAYEETSLAPTLRWLRSWPPCVGAGDSEM